MRYIVNHYNANPKHNRVHIFTNYKEAQEEYMKMEGEAFSGCSVLEIEGSPDDWKRRNWDRKRSNWTSGKFDKSK